MPSDLSRREASGDRKMLPLQTNGKAERGGAAVVWGTYKATIDTGATASFIRKKLAVNLAALGRNTRTPRQVRLADGRCGGIDEQLEVEIAFGNKRLSLSLLILPGVVVAMELSNTSRYRD